nr:Gag-Pol polyprotein [Tanacetum cinerariifolium]
QPEWQRFMTLVKQSQELKNVSYHKLYDILKQHQNEVNEIRAERIARTVNPLALVAQQQPVYHPQNHPTHYTQNSSIISQQAATRNRRKAILNSPQPIYDQEPSMVAEDDETSKDKEIHPQTHPTHYNQHSSTRTHQAATRKREKAIVNSPQPIYDQEPSMVDDDEDTSKEKEIDKLMALISLSFKKIYKPTNNNLRTLLHTSVQIRIILQGFT